MKINFKNILQKTSYINFTEIVWFLFYVFIFCYFLFNSFNYLDPDLGWHLKIGEQILKNESVPIIDNYTYTLEGVEWIDHEWLLDAFSFWIYKDFGYITLNILFAGLITLSLIILTIFVKKLILKDGNDFIIMAIQFLGALAMAPHLGVRMQEITLLSLLLLLIILELYNKRQKYKILLWLFPLFFFWANVHGGFLIGFFIMSVFLAVKIAEIIFRQNKIFSFFETENIFTKKQVLYTVIIFFFVPLATLLTPYGFKLYSFLGGYTNAYYLTHIAEWLPVFHWPISYKQMAYSAIFVTFLIFSILDTRKNLKTKNGEGFKFDLWKLSLSLLFLLLAFKSRRHFPLFFFVSFLPLIQCLQNNLLMPPHISKIFKNILVEIYIIIMFLCIIILLFFNTKFTNTPFLSPYFCQKYPCEAIDFIKENGQLKNLKIFNSYSWGGFMLWTWPEKKLFIDGRMPQQRYASHTILEEYNKFFEEKKAEEKLNEHNIELTLIPAIKPLKFSWFEKYILGLNEEKINNKKNYLEEFLNNDNHWELIYHDNISKVYRKIN